MIFIVDNVKHDLHYRNITTDELRETLRTLGDVMENEEIEEFVNHADKNKDGKINYNGKTNYWRLL